MIEILGVLALIGVLTVGGITGYSKAMWMYKTNKQTEQFGVILRALIYNRDQFNINDKSTDTVYITPLLKALGEIPDEMIIPNNNNYIQDAFGVRYTIYHHDTGYVGINSSINSSDDSVKICQNMYMLGKKFSQDIFAMETIVRGNNSYTSYVYGDKYCTGTNKCLKDLAPHDLPALCRVCEEGNTCGLYFLMWYY